MFPGSGDDQQLCCGPSGDLPEPWSSLRMPCQKARARTVLSQGCMCWKGEACPLPVPFSPASGVGGPPVPGGVRRGGDRLGAHEAGHTGLSLSPQVSGVEPPAPRCGGREGPARLSSVAEQRLPLHRRGPVQGVGQQALQDLWPAQWRRWQQTPPAHR